MFGVATSGVCFSFRLMDYFLADGGFKSVLAANWMDRMFAGACFPAFFTVLKASVSDKVGRERETVVGERDGGERDIGE